MSIAVLLTLGACAGPGGAPSWVEDLRRAATDDPKRVKTAECAPAGPTLRIEFVGLVDLVATHGAVGGDGWQQADLARIVLPDTRSGELGDLAGIRFAKHRARLEYRQDWVDAPPDALNATPVDPSADPVWMQVPLETWEVSVESPGSGPLELARHEIGSRDAPQGGNRCSLGWVPSMDRLVASWGAGGKFDDDTMNPRMPRVSKVASRFVLDAGRIFTGSFHGTNAGPCKIDLDRTRGAMARTVAHTRPLEGAGVVLVFQRLHDPQEEVRLVLKPTEDDLRSDDFEMWLPVRHEPVNGFPGIDFVAHYGLREDPPRQRQRFPLPGSCRGFLEVWPMSSDPQCSPADNDFP